MEAVMDQKEHIATLCALGTVGAAAAGFAFGTSHADPHVLRPGKRKWPGSSGQGWSSLMAVPALSRRSISQPVTPLLTSDTSGFESVSVASKRFSSAPKIFGPSRDTFFNGEPSSRDSSKSRRSALRPTTAGGKSTAEKRESGSSLGWMKRLSSYSSISTSTVPSVGFPETDDTTPATFHLQQPSTSTLSMPNKLVKRSTSQRALSHDEARGQMLKRPATSQQRSQALKEILARPLSERSDRSQARTSPSTEPSSLPAPTEKQFWKPYFESRLPRKRRRSDSVAESGQIRVVSMPSRVDPFILLGSDVDSAGFSSNDCSFMEPLPTLIESPHVTRRRSRRSLASLRQTNPRRRNFTDPSLHVSRAAASGTMLPISRDSLSSPKAKASFFSEPTLPDTPQLASSPPLPRHGLMAYSQNRHSMSMSDQPTLSSDNEARVFSDTDSRDFKSDTNYDSIATRATNGSQTFNSDSKLDTIFAVQTIAESESRPGVWHNLSRDNLAQVDLQSSPFYKHDVRMHGIGISVPDGSSLSAASYRHDVDMVTPPQSPSFHLEDMLDTPIPAKHRTGRLDSSSPMLPISKDTKDYDRVGDMLDDMRLDDDAGAWSLGHEPASNGWRPQDIPLMLSPINTENPLIKFKEPSSPADAFPELPHQPSIFDWSEHHTNMNYSRPKTVHGKQGNGDRSRTSGRKGMPQLHFRSQSVPVNRDAPNEDLPAVSKYKTWRIGQKPVSEEWSDDFEFEDAETVVDSPAVDAVPQAFHGSVRSVRIPQTILDRQPSVHLQFGQVQEFMALVEELKRLQARGAELRLLDGQAKLLWKDAESIINLATINDEEMNVVSSSPSSADPFADVFISPVEIKAKNTPAQSRRPTMGGRRSVSTMTPPPILGRARGESLAQARHFLQAMHENRDGIGSSPREIEIHKQKKLPFDTQDLKDLVVRSGVITRALKDELRKAEGVPSSPLKTPPKSKKRENDDDHPLNKMFEVPDTVETSSPCPPALRKPGLPKSRSANGYLEIGASARQSGPFSSPMALTTVV